MLNYSISYGIVIFAVFSNLGDHTLQTHIPITGGAGFIGSHVAEELLKEEYSVKVLDSLLCQVHGPSADRPAYLRDVEFIKGDVRDPIAVSASLKGIGAVIHLAAMVGVGQSMYEVSNYTSVNICGTSVLLEAIIARPVERLIVTRKRSLSTVLQELKDLLSKGVEHVYFMDELFQPDESLLSAFENLHFKFGVQLHIDLWEPSMLSKLGRAGCVSIEAGIESITEKGRSSMNTRPFVSFEESIQRLIYAKSRDTLPRVGS